MKKIRIKHIQYNEIAQSFTVTFNGGSIYEYAPVTKEVYDDLLNTEFLSMAVQNIIRSENIVGVRK